ncbi:hypothetical protein [Flavobacterium sp. HSC-61S13]|uniref:hypothetical protein n=1 Tax=Flavobacterium sp. HSC-61S13 TaxID=2910963 RepID=UPI0020A19D45|nr:hypothetical protein [Flavobacterium sp. HSC-61S13]MCP1994356.1 hypothetical protein [Flavobacterium sp. HSC-61S13]
MERNLKKPLFDDLILKSNFTDITHLLFKDESDILNLKTKINQLDTQILNDREKERLKSLINIFLKKTPTHWQSLADLFFQAFHFCNVS